MARQVSGHIILLLLGSFASRSFAQRRYPSVCGTSTIQAMGGKQIGNSIQNLNLMMLLLLILLLILLL